MYVIMCDATEITTMENAGTLNACFVLKEGVPQKYIPFGLFRNTKRESIFRVMDWFEDRAFPEERTDCKKLLDELGLERYNAWDIIKKTRGTLMTDYFWLKIDKDDTYEKCSIRGAANIPPVNVFENKIDILEKF